MFKALMKGIILTVNQLVNMVTSPIDSILNYAFPDISTKAEEAVSGVVQFLNNLSYGIGFLPNSLVEILIFIFTLHLTLIAVNKSVNGIVKIFHIIQKIKFW